VAGDHEIEVELRERVEIDVSQVRDFAA